MAQSQPDRPDPDALLAETRSAKRGKLKIFLGASPGVGKTYAMLEEARGRARAGVDVVAALVETHGRAETAALMAGLDVLPRRLVSYAGHTLDEFDLDGLLARRPALALIDELAHTNAPGSRHPKRWQDVMEALDAGLDVLTTLNIQHIESLNDVVARITGVRVQETVPDELLTRADEIELIDLPPEALIERLREGKVYMPAQAGRALENFFTKGNLTALRELALRTTASRVDDEMIAWMRGHAVKGPWPTQERLLVCVNEAPAAKALIRTAKRMAERARIPWIAATVVTPRHEALGPEAREATADALRLAETLGAETATLTAETDAAAELLAYARKRNVTRLIIGRPRRKGFLDLFREPVSDKLLDAAKDFEVTVVAEHARAERRRLLAVTPPKAEWRPHFFAALATFAATLVALPLSIIGGAAVTGSLSVVFLAAVLGVGSRYGLWPSITTSLLSFLAYNFLFTEPYFTFVVSSASEVAALFVFLLGAIFTGSLAGRLKAQVEGMRAAQRRTETLYAFARKIASATKADDVLWAAAAHIAASLDCRSLIMMPDSQGHLEQVQGHPSIDDDLDAKDTMAARWAFDKNEPAGAGTATLPTASWLFLPLATSREPMGVIGVRFRDAGRGVDPETKRLIVAVEDQVAVAIERLRLTADLETARMRTESEKLREALLSSVSHDLRTPLVTVIGALTAMTDGEAALTEMQRAALGEEALGEARRLDRFVRNLLDMTRLGYGAPTLRRQPSDLREIIGRARADLARVLAGHDVAVHVPRDLPRLDVDPVLIGQVLANILENASKYAPAGSTITIAARREGAEIVIAVADRGPGIPEAERTRVFDHFHRAAGDGQPAGTGLGLAIVKGLAEAHGGTAQALAGPDGIGTTIEVRLPVASPETESEEP